MTALKKGEFTSSENKEKRSNRVNIKDIESKADEFSQDFLKLDRSHKISFLITTADLLKFKAYCIKNKINQQDKAYLVFKDWIIKEDINI